ncbi:sigma-70 family RNA polymerase sigma factor [Flavobacteriaceae bacterium R38]|nr:sigma-70 family RNA polymerase sigma factor [Flavobacteriaceae bacterium R38]
MKQSELIKACKRNSYKAQMKAYQLYKDALFNTSIRFLKNEHDAQDVVHDAFIKGFQNIEKLDDEGSLIAWLKRIVINCSLDFIKKKKKMNWLDDGHITLEQESTEEDLNEKEYPSMEKIKKAIDQLKDKYRIIVVLYLIENYTHKEIAEVLDLNESTVRNQYRRGKNQLKEQLQNTMTL